MAATGLNRPDFRKVSDFRKRHLVALQGLVLRVLTLYQRAGLVKLGHVTLDGAKVKSNASKHQAMSYGRMPETQARLEKIRAAQAAVECARLERRRRATGARHRAPTPPCIA